MNELMITQAQHLQQSTFEDLVPLLNIHPSAFLCIFFPMLYTASRVFELFSQRFTNRWIIRNVFRSSDVLCFLWMLLEASRYTSSVVFTTFRALGYPWTIPPIIFNPAILVILYIPHVTSLFRLFAFAYPNTTLRWGRYRYGKMAIDMLQRYYHVELLWMRYIAPVYAALAVYLTWEDHGRPNVGLTETLKIWKYRLAL